VVLRRLRRGRLRSRPVRLDCQDDGGDGASGGHASTECVPLVV
jgi:hypothetical protein